MQRRRSVPHTFEENIAAEKAKLEAQVAKLTPGPQKDALLRKSRSRKFGQDDKWNFCLTAAIIAVNRRNHEQTTPAQPLTGLQDPMGRWIATGALSE
jgi:hypothetical protein